MGMVRIILKADVMDTGLVTPHSQRERGKVIGVGVHIYIYIYIYNRKTIY